MPNPRWEQLLRYRYIELIALWEGRLTTRQLCDTFSIGRQQANKDLSSYRRGLTCGDLVYDAVAKHEPLLRNLIVDLERGMGFGLPRATEFNRTWDGYRRKNRQLHVHPMLILDRVKGLADNFAKP